MRSYEDCIWKISEIYIYIYIYIYVSLPFSAFLIGRNTSYYILTNLLICPTPWKIKEDPIHGYIDMVRFLTFCTLLLFTSE